MIKFDIHQFEHYKKILSHYTYQNYFSQYSNSENLLVTPLYQIHQSVQNLQHLFNYTQHDALHIIYQNENIFILDINSLTEKNNYIKKIIMLNQKQTNELIKSNPNILNYNEEQLSAIRNCLSTKLNFSQQDILECLINNKNLPYHTDEIINKFNYIQNQLKYTQTNTITLCRLSSILSLPVSDIAQNINLIQSKLKLDQIADIFPIFNCSFAENLNKGELLAKNNLPIYSIIYLWQITYSQLLSQKEYLAKMYPYLSSKLCFLPLQDFNNKLYKEKNIVNILTLQAYKRYNKINKQVFSFNKHRDKKTDLATINRIRIGKRTRIIKEDKIDARLLCKTKLETSGVFVKTRKIQLTNIKTNQNLTAIQRKIAEQIQKKATRN